MPMKIAMCLPYMERDLDRDRLLGWCRALDAGPFSSIACGERITGYTVEMRAVLSAAAAVTERVRIVPSLYVLPMHSAVWAAKEIATLDLLSDGRVTAVVGVGGREVDYAAVGAPFARRHARMDEQVAQMRRIWAGEPALPGGDEVGPRPVQPGGPPILAGVMGPKATARAAHWADGVYSWSGNGVGAEIEAAFGMVGRAWEEAGRSTAPTRAAGFWFSLADDSQRRLCEYVYEYLKVFGDGPARAIAQTVDRNSPDAVRESIDAYEAAGCEELFLVPATSDLREVEAAARIVESR